MEQGVTKPVLCRADDGCRYVVKTRLSGRDAVVKEWLCYEIGTRLGLPIPKAEIVYMDSTSSRFSDYPEASALADCPGFGSTLIEPTDVLTASEIGNVPFHERALVLLFDWWVMNEDRQDGNPNLLRLQHGGKLHVIDHNLAFGNDDPHSFWKHHLFRHDRPAIVLLRTEKMPIMNGIFEALPSLWNELPVQWTEHCIIGLERVDQVLRRCLDDEFWVVP